MARPSRCVHGVNLIKNIFLVFHFLTTVSAIVPAIVFFAFYSKSRDSVNLVVFVPALIISGILVLNSYFMYLGQFNTKYFFAMRAVTIVGGIIVPVAMAFVAAAFRGPNSRQGLLGSMREDFLSLPSVILRTLNEEPHLLFFAGFPLFAIVTAFTSFFFKRA